MMENEFLNLVRGVRQELMKYDLCKGFFDGGGPGRVTIDKLIMCWKIETTSFRDKCSFDNQ